MLTLDDAVTRARAIQRALDKGELTVPYSASVLAELHECSRAFNEFCDTPEATLVLAKRLDAPELELPW